MKQNLSELLRELRINPRTIREDELWFILDELTYSMGNGGFETEVSVKLKFFFDSEGKPFAQATVPHSNSPVSLYVGDNFELPFLNGNGKPLVAEEAPRMPAKHEQTPPTSGEQKITLLNTLINFPMMCIFGLYDQIKYEYFKILFSTSFNKKDKNKAIRKIKDRAEANLFRATYGQPNLMIGRPEKSPKDIEAEKTKFLRNLFYAFKSWSKDQKFSKSRKSKSFPTQSDLSEKIMFSGNVKNPRKKLSLTLKQYDLNFKELWKIYSKDKNLEIFLTFARSVNIENE